MEKIYTVYTVYTVHTYRIWMYDPWPWSIQPKIRLGVILETLGNCCYRMLPYLWVVGSAQNWRYQSPRCYEALKPTKSIKATLLWDPCGLSIIVRFCWLSGSISSNCTCQSLSWHCKTYPECNCQGCQGKYHEALDIFGCEAVVLSGEKQRSRPSLRNAGHWHHRRQQSPCLPGCDWTISTTKNDRNIKEISRKK